MINRSIILLGVVLFMATGCFARKKQDCPRADIKVGYNYHEKFMRSADGPDERDVPMLLLANSRQSKFFSRDTEYKDSLESTPGGRAVRKKILDEAVRHALETGDQSRVSGYAYKTYTYVYKDYAKAQTTVYDQAGLMERGVYDEPFSEIEWMIGDSIKTVLGYECTIATADYHGRKWTAWFAPEIPIQDGPWKLQGLPGLILEAAESGGQHRFVADGIEQTSQPIYPMFRRKEYDRMGRIDMLKGLRNYRDNGLSMAKASTGLDLGSDAPSQPEYDFLETDYRE